MLTDLVLLLLVIATVVLWLPALSELLCLPRRRDQLDTSSGAEPTPRLLFLIPAHNEELMIQGCVRSLLAMRYPTGAARVVVIADNCTDSTASLVRAAGAECLERADQTLTGKPRAIAWALAQFDLSQFDACVVVDADSTVAPDFAAGIARLAPLNGIVFQANIGVLNEFDGWLTRLGGLLSRCRYDITYPLKQAAGLNCPITGNGMGFGTGLLTRYGWLSYSITEDSELYAIYTKLGVTIRQARGATLFAQEENKLEQGVTQRRRWLGGRLRAIRDWGAPILTSKEIGWHQKLDAFVELGLASPIVHVICASALIAVAFALLPARDALWLAAAAAASLSGLAITTVIAIRRHPEPAKTVLSFAMLPVYAVWRCVVLLRTLVTLHDTTWRRTSRTARALPMPDLHG